MAVTIRDVAREARVSIATVSRVVNGHGNVTDATRTRILGVAERLHYVPDSAARSLITGLTHTVGVLLPDLYGEYFSELLRGIDRAARLRGLHLLVSSSHGDAGEAMLALRAMHGRVDGVLIMSPYVDAKLLDRALAATLPTVLMNTPAEAGRAPAFVTDNYGGARAMVEHFRALGYERIALIAGPDGNYEAAERLRGFRTALGRTRTADLLIYPGQFTEESGYLAGRQIAAAKERPDAVFAANDMMAIGCLFALTEAGLRVPQDIALGGFDDIPIARFVTPPLTTVRAQTADLGRQALEELARVLENPKAVRRARHTLPSRLVIRSSCGDARAPAVRATLPAAETNAERGRPADSH